MFDNADGSISFSVDSSRELKKAFRYYNYVREFYGYLLDSIGWTLEPEDSNFNPATAPAEKIFPPEVDEIFPTSEQIAVDKCTRAITAYERMIEIVLAWTVEKYEEEKSKREWGLQDPEKFALTSIAEMLFMPTIWYEFDERSQKALAKLGDDAQSAVMMMEPLMLEDAIGKIFAEQRKCLEDFLPRKLEELKNLLAERGI